MNQSTISLTVTVNTPVKLYFQSLTSGADLSTLVVVHDDLIVATPTVTNTAIGITGLYSVNLTPTSTGKWVVMLNTFIIAYIDVVTKTVADTVKNLEDEALGSWVWNKQTGVLNMLRQDGTALANFNVIENLTTASRERI